MKNHISCIKNKEGSKIICKLCLDAYIRETGGNMHTKAKSHLTFYSKKQETRISSAFFKHIANTHGSSNKGDTFADCLEIFIIKKYRKPFMRGDVH